MYLITALLYGSDLISMEEEQNNISFKNAFPFKRANNALNGISRSFENADQKLSYNKNRLKRSFLLVGFDAEEKGLLGSKYFVETPLLK